VAECSTSPIALKSKRPQRVAKFKLSTPEKGLRISALVLFRCGGDFFDRTLFSPKRLEQNELSLPPSNFGFRFKHPTLPPRK
jgi:hypothetical protein